MNLIFCRQDHSSPFRASANALHKPMNASLFQDGSLCSLDPSLSLNTFPRIFIFWFYGHQNCLNWRNGFIFHYNNYFKVGFFLP